MKVDANTTFSQIYKEFKPGPLTTESKHLRLTGNSLHKHNPLMAHGKGADALAGRQQKYANAADAVKTAVSAQYGDQLADRVFNNLNLGNSVTLRDLKAIKREIQAELQTPTAKSDLSGLEGPFAKDAHTVLLGRSPGLEHASRAFEQFLNKNHELPTIEFVRAYHDLLDNPSKAGALAFVRDHVGNPDMNIYENNRDDARESVAALGSHPTRRDVEAALDKVVGDVNESFGGDMYKRFQADYAKD